MNCREVDWHPTSTRIRQSGCGTRVNRGSGRSPVEYTILIIAARGVSRNSARTIGAVEQSQIPCRVVKPPARWVRPGESCIHLSICPSYLSYYISKVHPSLVHLSWCTSVLNYSRQRGPVVRAAVLLAGCGKADRGDVVRQRQRVLRCASDREWTIDTSCSQSPPRLRRRPPFFYTLPPGRRRDCHLVAPPCTFIRHFNKDKQGVSVR